jgi:hypothetical protein
MLARMTRFEPQGDVSELAPHLHRYTLRGAASGLQFPPLCPNCGSAAAERLSCAKVFSHSDSDGPTRYVVSSIAVPFCDACIAKHRAQEVKRTLMSDLISSFATMDMLGAVFPALAALFLLYLALGDLFHARGTRMLVELGIGAVFGLIAWAQARAVWEQTAHLRVAPQSDVTIAFDFSDDTAPAFESARFVCAMRNPAFANAFRVLNIEREYLPASAQAQAERRRSKRLLWIFGALLAAFALWSVLQDLFG